MNLLERIEHHLAVARKENAEGPPYSHDPDQVSYTTGKIEALEALIKEINDGTVTEESTDAPDIDTQEAIKAIGQAAIEGAKAHGINVKEDEFTAVQPYTDTQAILFRVVDDEDGRSMKVDVRDAVFILPRINKHLDIYIREEAE